MIAFIERQGLVPGRGLFFPSFPDPGCALIAAGLEKAGIESCFFEGTERWLKLLLSDPDKTIYHAARKPEACPRANRLLSPFFGQGVDKLLELEDEFSATLEVLASNPGSLFFDIGSVNAAISLIEASYDVFEYELNELGAVNHPWVRSMAEEIASVHPKLAAFSIAGYFEPVTMALIKILSREFGIKTVGGGWIGLGKNLTELETLRREWGLDWLASGPGELLLPVLYESFEEKVIRIPNLVGLKVTDPEPVPLKQDLVVVPRYERFIHRPFLAPALTLPVSSNTGCYWKKCSFCPQGYNTQPYQEKPVDSLVDLFAEAKDKFGATHFFFADECISPSLAKRLCIALKKAGLLDLKLTSMVRPEAAFTSGLLEEMADCGFKALMWGVESGVQRVLDLMGKGTKVETIESVLRASHEAGIANYTFLLVGFPGETFEEAKATLEFARKNREFIDGAQLSRFVVYTTSEVGRHPHRFGIHLDSCAPTSEVNSRAVRSGLDHRKKLDLLYEYFNKNYSSFTSGNYKSFPHKYHSSISLLSLLYSDPITTRKSSVSEH